MKIILLDDVPTLGRRGEVRDVSDGYARNYPAAPEARPARHRRRTSRTSSRSRRARTRRRPSSRRDAQDAGPGHRGAALRPAPAGLRRGPALRLGGHAPTSPSFLSQHGIEVERRRIGLDEPIKTLGEFTRAGAPASRRHRPAEGVRRPGSSGGHPHRPAHLQDPAPQPGGRAGRAGGDPAGAREPAQGRSSSSSPPTSTRKGHRKIFDAMLALFERNEPVDLLTVSEELQAAQRASTRWAAPPPSASLVEEAATAAHLLSYGGDRPGEGAPARPHPHRHRDHRAELRGPRRRGQAARRRRAADLPDLRAAHAGLGLPGARHPQGHLRAHREALRPQGARHRARHRLRRPRPR